jgi:hypothetical protein
MIPFPTVCPASDVPAVLSVIEILFEQTVILIMLFRFWVWLQEGLIR